MKILALGINSRRPSLVEFTDDEMVTYDRFTAMFEKTDNITLSAKVALQQQSKRNGGLTHHDDDLIDYLSDGTLKRWGVFQVRAVKGVSTSAIGESRRNR